MQFIHFFGCGTINHRVLCILLKVFQQLNLGRRERSIPCNASQGLDISKSILIEQSTSMNSIKELCELRLDLFLNSIFSIISLLFTEIFLPLNPLVVFLDPYHCE